MTITMNEWKQKENAKELKMLRALIKKGAPFEGYWSNEEDIKRRIEFLEKNA